MPGLPGVRVGRGELHDLVQVNGCALHDDDAPAVDVGVDEEVASFQVFLDEFLILGGVPPADDEGAVARGEPAEPVIPPLLLEGKVLLPPGFLRDRPFHGREGARLLLLELLDLVVVAADVLLDRLVDVDFDPLPGKVDLHRRLGGVDRPDHLCRRILAVSFEDLFDLLPRAVFARRIERRYDPGDGSVVLVEHLHDPPVRLDLLLKPLDRLRLAPADHLVLGEAGFLGGGLLLLARRLRVERIQGLAERREPLADLLAAKHHRPAP